MATKPKTQAVEAITPPELPSVTTSPDFDIESAIADELLNDIDWQRVRTVLIRKAKAKFVEMLFGSGGDLPVNISQFPELAALPSHDDDRESAA